MRLWRPVGPKELELIEKSGWRAFPPRLPEQPIFYPVLNFEYAEQIARDWNSKDAKQGFKGYVTEFDVDDTYAARFTPQTVGGKIHKELWIPAEELDEFNAQIQGPIRVVATYANKKRTNP
jgi:hypothetical protein